MPVLSRVMANVNWQVARRPVDISAFSPDGAAPLGVMVVHGLDTALAQLPADIPVVYEIRGTAVSDLDEFRRLVDEAPDAHPGDFVIGPANKTSGVWIESL